MSAKSASVRARRTSVVAIRQARRSALRHPLVQERSSLPTPNVLLASEAALPLSAPLCAHPEQRARAGAVAGARPRMRATLPTGSGGQV